MRRPRPPRPAHRRRRPPPRPGESRPPHLPRRIVVGEVRDEAALDLLDAWQTGHPGGCATVHANDPLSALNRLDRLAQRAGVGPQPDLIADAIQLIVMIAGGARGRRMTEIAEVAGRAAGAYRLDPLPAL